MEHTVILFGDSITRGQFSADYVELLQERMGAEGFEFENNGINNDTTYNLLKRIRGIIDCCPDFIILLIGTNDVIASLKAVNAAFYIATKLLPRQPMPDWSLANVRQIIRRLKSESNAVIGAASIPMLGEDLNSAANWRVRYYNLALKQLTFREGVGYLPVFEHLSAALNSTHGRAYDDSVPLTAEFAFRHFLLKRTSIPLAGARVFN